VRIIDISVPLGGSIPVWPGEPRPHLDRAMRIEDGDVANVSHLSTSVHNGTHVDAPLHFLPGGATVDTLDLARLVGPAYVALVPEVDRIDGIVLESLGIPDDARRLLLRTTNSLLWDLGPEFEADFAALDPTGATWVVERGIELIGIDYLSIQRHDEDGFETHRILLRNGVVILEGLRLDQVAPGHYRLACLPILLADAEASPARAILIDDRYSEGIPDNA
jgi:arylformamidase